MKIFKEIWDYPRVYKEADAASSRVYRNKLLAREEPTNHLYPLDNNFNDDKFQILGAKFLQYRTQKYVTPSRKYI